MPTFERPAALAVTLACLLGQTYRDFRVVVSDQGTVPAHEQPEVSAVIRVLQAAGRAVDYHHHLPRRGVAEHRDFLLARATARRVLFLDDDVITEPDVVERLVRALDRERCGFIGSFVNAPSALSSTKPIDRAPADVTIEVWEGPVQPETVVAQSDEWRRSRVHFSSYLHEVTNRLGITKDSERLYKVAWVGGCVLYDTDVLRACGGFGFWRSLPAEHCGEDALAQLHVMQVAGGAALAPSGAWHQEVPTTVRSREADAPLVLLSEPRPLSSPPGRRR